MSKKTSRHYTKKIKIKIWAKGELTGLGYGVKKDTDTRRKALKKAALVYPPISIYHKLNALYVLNKNRHVTTARIFKRDRNWFKRNFM